MIDTDKYEGHTPVPWKFTDFDPLHLWGESPIISGGEGYSQNEADWKLIADAPLLLAEVKQFHAFDEYMRMLRNGQIDADDICDVWDEIRKEREE